MLDKNNIVFESSILADKFCKDKEGIINTVYDLTTRAIAELDIISLDKVTISDIVLFETVRGKTIPSHDTLGINLAYETAANLINNSNRNKYYESLATLYHELYHVLDIERVWKNLVKGIAENEFGEFKNGFHIWTEFFATYSTFEIQEKHNVYDSFENSITNSDNAQKTYYTSRILGYYLKNNHSQKCDELIKKHLNTTWVIKVKNHLSNMITNYPCITVNDLTILKKMTEKTIFEPIDLSKLKPIEPWELLQKLRKK